MNVQQFCAWLALSTRGSRTPAACRLRAGAKPRQVGRSAGGRSRAHAQPLRWEAGATSSAARWSSTPLVGSPTCHQQPRLGWRRQPWRRSRASTRTLCWARCSRPCCSTCRCGSWIGRARLSTFGRAARSWTTWYGNAIARARTATGHVTICRARRRCASSCAQAAARTPQ